MFRATVLVFSFALAANCHTQRRSAERRKEQLNCAPGKRHSHFAMLIKVPSKDTEVVVATLSRYDLSSKWKFCGNSPATRQVAGQSERALGLIDRI